jgi:hypothetical protein
MEFILTGNSPVIQKSILAVKDADHLPSDKKIASKPPKW